MSMPDPSPETLRGRVLIAARLAAPERWRAVVCAALAYYGSVHAAADALDVDMRVLRRWRAEDPVLAAVPVTARGRPTTLQIYGSDQLRDLVARVGGVAAAATAAGIPPSHLRTYMARGRIPERVFQRIAVLPQTTPLDYVVFKKRA